MKSLLKNASLALLSLLVSISVFAQSKVLKSLEMSSKLLNTSVQYSVYLPDGYESSQQEYPVVYLLNGFTGGETDWIILGNMQSIVDNLILNNSIEPLVIVMPDGDDRLYMNKDDGTYPYEDMLINEFLPYVEKKFRIKDEKKYRGISGLSMGGAGSLRLTLKHLEIFSSCAAFSSAVLTNEEAVKWDDNFYDNYFGRISDSHVGLKGLARLTETYNDYNVLHLVKTKNPELLKSVNIYFDCGDDDFLTIGNSQLHIELRKKGIPHEYRVRDGGHTWDYWQDSLPIGLKFIDKNFGN
jgi:enterochelin esterase-like enzyme